MDDFTLLHLRAVFVTKLRRDKGFLLTGEGEAGSPVTVWVHRSILIVFEFRSLTTLGLDPIVLGRMMEASDSSGGLTIPGPTLSTEDLGVATSFEAGGAAEWRDKDSSLNPTLQLT